MTRILVDGVRVNLFRSCEMLSLTLVEIDARVEKRIVVSFAESSGRSAFRYFLRKEFPAVVAKL